jgi:hypothetical protein
MSEGEVQHDTPEPLIPWEQRRRIGFMKAYWRTVFHVLARRGRLAEDLAAPLDLRAARGFRRRTVAYAVLGWAATAAILIGFYRDTGVLSDAEQYNALIDLAGAAFLLTLSLLAVTGATGWFFASREFDDVIQDRAIAIAYYTCAPLAFAFGSPILLAAGLLVLRGQHVDKLLWAIGILNMPNLASWYLLAVSAVHSVTGRRVGRTVLAAVLLPVVWTGLPILIGSAPAAVLMWPLLIASLT